ncbi:MAG TPA: DUF637 domain-containing protein [Alphaproteobacteria bacterium]|nr:DUF637 domain-containing protein [Alphaproteobacteria bacterium]
MISAAASTLLSQTALSLLSNGGSFKKTLKTLGSKQSLCTLGMNVASAGILCGIGVPGQPLGFEEHLYKNVANTAVSGGCSAIQGEKLEFKQLALGIAVNTVGGMIANRLGQQGHYDGELDYVSHKALHTLLGGAMGAGIVRRQ